MSSGPHERVHRRLRSPSTRYRPVARLAVGGMAEVWSGEAVLEGGEVVPVAIKRVLPQMGDAMFLKMFEDEARLGMLLDHPNIVRVYDARDVGGTYIMIMELVLGDTLKGLLDPAHERQRPMPVPVALHVGRELARGLGYAHEATEADGTPLGIIHRDVSPHNLLLGKDGSVKLTDFGLADASVNETQREDGMVGGKFGYFAPEILRQERHDHRVDLFALGIVLWEMLAGRRLFHGPDERETLKKVLACEVPYLPALNPGVPEEVDQVVRAILHPDPDQRYRSGHDIAEALTALVDWLAPDCGAADVALLVKLHLAMKAKVKPVEIEPIGLAYLLAQELEAFQQKASGADAGEVPLDPTSFDRGLLGRRRH